MENLEDFGSFPFSLRTDDVIVLVSPESFAVFPPKENGIVKRIKKVHPPFLGH